MKPYGIARIQLTISQVHFAESAALYHALMTDFFERKEIPVDHPDLRYWVAGNMAFAIPGSSERASPDRVGLHHVCFRARCRNDVDRAAALVRLFGEAIVFGPAERPHAPGAYSLVQSSRSSALGCGLHRAAAADAVAGYIELLTLEGERL